MRYILGLGSNKGAREDFLHRANAFLAGLGTVKKKSSVYESTPVGMEPGTSEFLNQVVALETEIPPAALLRRIKEFEKECGRNPGNSHRKSREIDIDILLAGTEIIHSARLTIPHPEIENRKFVLLPLAEIFPGLEHPVSGKTAEEMLKELKSGETVKMAGSGDVENN